VAEPLPPASAIEVREGHQEVGGGPVLPVEEPGEAVAIGARPLERGRRDGDGELEDVGDRGGEGERGHAPMVSCDSEGS